MRLKGIIDEVFQDYKKPSMLLITFQCNWKCLTEAGLDISICQNSELAKQKNIDVSYKKIIERYINNPITQAIVIAGLEPMLQFEDILEFIKRFRKVCNDDVVIYTGYDYNEIKPEIEHLEKFNNIIVKFGRYKANSEKRFDDVLGVWLISDNQYATKIS